LTFEHSGDLVLANFFLCFFFFYFANPSNDWRWPLIFSFGNRHRLASTLNIDIGINIGTGVGGGVGGGDAVHGGLLSSTFHLQCNGHPTETENKKERLLASHAGASASRKTRGTRGKTASLISSLDSRQYSTPQRLEGPNRRELFFRSIS
jgi:hypothetical protein